MSKNIFAIPGSLRAGSSNHSILKIIGDMMPDGINYQIYDGLSIIPPFDPGLDNDTPPQAVTALRNLITNADAIIICTPEYAYGVPGQLKNAIDWMVSSGSFSGKLTALITASTGGENAHTALLKILGAVDAIVPAEATLLVSYIRSKMNAEGIVTDKETAEGIKRVVNALQDHSSR
jgi:NAD(P)H-dependent FMN reductase